MKKTDYCQENKIFCLKKRGLFPPFLKKSTAKYTKMICENDLNRCRYLVLVSLAFSVDLASHFLC